MNIIGRHKTQMVSLESLSTLVDAAKLASEFAQIGEVATAFTTALDSCAELREPLRTCKLSLTGKMISAFKIACVENLQSLNGRCSALHGKNKRQKWQRDFAFWAEGLAVAKAAMTRRDSMAPELAAEEAAGLPAGNEGQAPRADQAEQRLPARAHLRSAGKGRQGK